ncbi:unnamed protein product [Dibothriocephalus latus]|uniref:Uncharacterized protein n=1 Tax=Dibothriocephalus latus TaxID=60516 RepID=A0A3P6SH63_DIBLA|nr:unnamed protein product [Dibothriocephalus latus]
MSTIGMVRLKPTVALAAAEYPSFSLRVKETVCSTLKCGFLSLRTRSLTHTITPAVFCFSRGSGGNGEIRFMKLAVLYASSRTRA